MSPEEERYIARRSCFHQEQYNELECVFSEEWSHYFNFDWRTLSEYQLSSLLHGNKGLLDLSNLFDEMKHARDKYTNSCQALSELSLQHEEESSEPLQ
jgi:hypothetical protein